MYVVPPRSASPQLSQGRREPPVEGSAEIPRPSTSRRPKRVKIGKARRGRGKRTFASHKEAFDLVLGSVSLSQAIPAPSEPVVSVVPCSPVVSTPAVRVSEETDIAEGPTV